ncbi:MAG: peptide chain release factor 1 [Limnochordia bacterium]|jgi:peptide chain release factor 1|nr:peptide chain release factor 1 [Limnochordia bacterium]MDD4518289.1 peptide chain release factor 1 [Limnochordia bacterium]
MFDQLENTVKRYQELTEKLGDPKVIGQQQLYTQYAKEYADLGRLVELYGEYKEAVKELADLESMSTEDPEMQALIDDEFEQLTARKERLVSDLRVLLLPKDPNDDKNVIMEIRAGAGGDEAALFAADLFRMYSKYAEAENWKIETMSTNTTGLDGFKEVIFTIAGKGAYSRLKYESGVHRVQRVPTTEASGRIHTSTATVAVLPEAEEVEVEINPQDIRIDVFRSTGPGGQSVNTTDSAVRITYIPTGMVVSCQDEKSQHKNKDKAMRILRARLLDKIQQEQEEKLSSARRSQVGTGERSERIRTYNFPQGRVTDHRIGLTLYHLEQVMEGQLDQIIEPLIEAEQKLRLQNLEVEA